MYTLDDIYDRLDTGAEGAKREGAFTEPSASPAPTGPTLDNIMGKAPAVDANGASAADVLTGKTFWGLLTGGGWGTLAGTMTNVGPQSITPGTSAQTITQGYHDGTGAVAGDTDLAGENIKKDVVIFGVTGTYPLAGVAKTGQTPIVPLESPPAGSDGALQKGVAWPSPRFTDNLNGTVTDNLTGLIWLKNANKWGAVTWDTALANCNNLEDDNSTLTDGSSAGDWRLPNVMELLNLIDWGYFNPALCNALGTAQWTQEDAFTDVQLGYYSFSTTYQGGTSAAWRVALNGGDVKYDYKYSSSYVWPVRDAQ